MERNSKGDNEMKLLIIIGCVLLLFVVLGIYACLVIGSMADDEMEEMFKKEEEK